MDQRMFARLCLLPCLFLCSFISFPENESSVSIYYNHRNLAERAILREEWVSAARHYYAAFRAKAEPFGRDVRNLMVIEDRLGLPDSVQLRLKYLIERGASLKYMREARLIDHFLNTGNGRHFLSTASFIRPIYDANYRDSVGLLFRRDQEFRLLSSADQTYSDTIRRTDHANILALLHLMRIRGYPSERSIGLDEEGKAAPYYFILLVHQAQGPEQQFNIGDQLTEAIRRGELEHELGSMMINHMNGRYTFSYDLTRLMLVKLIDTTKSASRPSNQIPLDSTAYGFFPLSDKELAQINESRHQFFLDDYETGIRKSMFSRRHPEFILGGELGGSSMILTDPGSFEELRSKLLLE